MTITAESTQAGERDEPGPVRSVAFVRFFLRFTEPGAVTVPGHPDRDDNAAWGRERAHLLIDTDPWGRPHLPATSLAGALRETVCRADGTAAANELFGHLLPQGSGGTEVDARASLLWVLGSRPVDVDGSELASMTSQVRASTAISRTRAAAEQNTLRVEEVLPIGSRFEVFLRWDDAPQAGLDRLLAQLAVWQPLIGRGTSRGRGRCVVDGIYRGALELSDPADLHRWLTVSGPDLARAVATEPAQVQNAASGPEPLMAVAVRFVGPLRVGSGEPPEPTGSRGQKVTPIFRDGDSYVLPGTGLKGLLRSRAEYLLRSVGMTPEICLDQRCGTCWTCQVFGHAGGQDVKAKAVGARALIRIPDAVIGGPPKLVQRQHVAIDRFTGGGQEGLLYTVDALESGSFTITVELFDGEEITADRLAQIRAVLRLVFEDLNDGIAGVGAGVARGYGSVTVDLADAEQRGDLPNRLAAQQQVVQMVAASVSGQAS